MHAGMGIRACLASLTWEIWAALLARMRSTTHAKGNRPLHYHSHDMKAAVRNRWLGAHACHIDCCTKGMRRNTPSEYEEQTFETEDPKTFARSNDQLGSPPIL